MQKSLGTDSKNGFSRLRQQKSRRKESLWWIPELGCMWSLRETLTLPNWRPWRHRGIRWRWCEVQTREQATENDKELDLFVTVMFLDETPRSSSSREALRGSWVYLPLDQRSKTTSHQKWQEHKLQYIKLCAIRSPWFIDEFLYNTHTNFFIIFITGFCFWHQMIHRKSSTQKKWKYEWGASYGETRCINQQKPKTKKEMKDVKKYKAIYHMNCRIGCRSSDRKGALELGQIDLGQRVYSS